MVDICRKSTKMNMEISHPNSRKSEKWASHYISKVFYFTKERLLANMQRVNI